MALIKCPECGKEFSDKAQQCPNCGCPSHLMKMESDDLIQTVDQKTENPAFDNSKMKKKHYLLWAILFCIGSIALLIASFLIGDSDSAVFVYIAVSMIIAFGIFLGIKIIKAMKTDKKYNTKHFSYIFALLICCVVVFFFSRSMLGSIFEGPATDKAAIEACQDLKDRMKNPDAFVIKEVISYHDDYDHAQYYIIEYTGTNSFGGTMIETAVYKYGRYLGDLSENSSLQMSIDTDKVLGKNNMERLSAKSIMRKLK